MVKAITIKLEDGEFDNWKANAHKVNKRDNPGLELNQVTPNDIKNYIEFKMRVAAGNKTLNYANYQGL